MMKETGALSEGKVTLESDTSLYPFRHLPLINSVLILFSCNTEQDF